MFRKRKRKEDGKDRSRSFVHFIIVKNKSHKVYQGAFLRIRAVRVTRLKRIKCLLISGSIPKDNRDSNVKENVTSDACLNVTIMNELFIKK